jgi:hypothetical protein
MHSLQSLLELSSFEWTIAILIELLEGTLGRYLSSLENLGDFVENFVLPLERIIPVLKTSAKDFDFLLELVFLLQENIFILFSFFIDTLMVLLLA